MTGRSHARDRAAVASKTVVHILGEALRAWFHGDQTDFGATRAAIEAILREEFEEIARQVQPVNHSSRHTPKGYEINEKGQARPLDGLR
jgi:hypothetical protein